MRVRGGVEWIRRWECCDYGGWNGGMRDGKGG